ncbi:hypothetical protein [Streptacidiphilus sp. EB129]|uniref:hypothetical protein n=1 Tax=Streptacidiphilus sp. EB129 TaxID=3156262 RepID=UPI003512BB6A
MHLDPTLQALFTAARHRTAQLRAFVRQRQPEPDKGALSIELALLVGALVVIAVAIVAILIAKATQKGAAIG